MGFIFIFAGVFVGFVLQVCILFINAITSVFWNKKFFNPVNRLALHGLLGGLEFVVVSITSPNGALWGMQLHIGGFLVLGCAWCGFAALLEKHRQSASLVRS